jgi:hypothetical protein
MQQIKVKGFQGIGVNGSEAIRFNMLGKSTDGVHTLQFNVTHCREQIVNGLRKHVSGIKDMYFCGEKFNPVRTKVVLTQNHRTIDKPNSVEKIKKQREDGLKIVNIFERYSAWPLTKMCSIEVILPPLPPNAIFKFDAETYAYIGSTKWVRSPYMLSLYLLLLRAGTIPGLGDCVDLDDFITTVRKYKPNKLDPYSKQSGDLEYLQSTLNKLKFLLDNYEALFEFRPLLDNYRFESIYHPDKLKELRDEGNLYGTSFNDGIDKLVRNTISDWQVKLKIKELEKKCVV